MFRERLRRVRGLDDVKIEPGSRLPKGARPVRRRTRQQTTAAGRRVGCLSTDAVYWGIRALGDVLVHAARRVDTHIGASAAGSGSTMRPREQTTIV